MSNVIPIKPKQKLTWVCTSCNCASFYLYDDHSVECAGCHKLGKDNGEWVIWLPPPEDGITKTDIDVVNTVVWGDSTLARRRVMRYVAEWDKDIAILAVWHKDGTMRAWDDANSPNQRKWAVTKIAELAKSINDAIVDE